MPVSPAFAESNRGQTERLRKLVADLDASMLAVRLPNGWTVAVALAHIAFWDRQRLCLMRRWAAGNWCNGGYDGELFNEVLLPFLEAIRQFKNDVGRNHVAYVHLTLVPFVGASEEFKSKPTQHSVNQLRSIGIQPDVIVCRSEKPIGDSIREKVALFGDVPDRAAADSRRRPFVPVHG